MNHANRTLAALAALMLTAAPAAVLAQSDSDAAKDKKAPAAEKKAADKPKDKAAEKAKEGDKKEVKKAGPPPTGDTVVVTVNGKAITLAELIAVRRNLPKQYQQYPDTFLMRALVEQMANQAALADAGIKAGIEKTRLAKALVVSQRRAILADLYVRQRVKELLTDAAIKEAYDKRFAKAKPVQQVRASHILVKTEEKAKQLKKELDSGAKFADLAAKHGTDGTKARGGDLGWFSQKRMVPAFAKAAFALKKDEISSPVKTRFGWHLILKTGERTSPIPKLAQVRTALVRQLSQQLQQKVVKEARAAAKIDAAKTAIPPKAIRMDNLLTD